MNEKYMKILYHTFTFLKTKYEQSLSDLPLKFALINVILNNII